MLLKEVFENEFVNNKNNNFFEKTLKLSYLQTVQIPLVS